MAPIDRTKDRIDLAWTTPNNHFSTAQQLNNNNNTSQHHEASHSRNGKSRCGLFFVWGVTAATTTWCCSARAWHLWNHRRDGLLSRAPSVSRVGGHSTTARVGLNESYLSLLQSAGGRWVLFYNTTNCQEGSPPIGQSQASSTGCDCYDYH